MNNILVVSNLTKESWRFCGAFFDEADSESSLSLSLSLSGILHKDS